MSILLLLALFYSFLVPSPLSSPVDSSQQQKDLPSVSLTEAYAQGDASLCARVTPEEKQKICYMYFNSCSSDECFYDKALAFSREDLCFEIQDEEKRISCSAILGVNSVITSAVIENNISKCLDFEDDVSQQACENNYYYVQSVNLENKSYCEFISGNEGAKNDCFTR